MYNATNIIHYTDLGRVRTAPRDLFRVFFFVVTAVKYSVNTLAPFFYYTKKNLHFGVVFNNSVTYARKTYMYPFKVFVLWRACAYDPKFWQTTLLYWERLRRRRQHVLLCVKRFFGPSPRQSYALGAKSFVRHIYVFSTNENIVLLPSSNRKFSVSIQSIQLDVCVRPVFVCVCCWHHITKRVIYVQRLTVVSSSYGSIKS